MTFKDFISSRKSTHDERGDFIRLVNADPNMPDLHTWAELRKYIEVLHGNYRITDAGADLWKEYEAAERKLGNA